MRDMLGPIHVSGLQMEDCKQFRQWESKTPGHPENFETEGIEVTTGAALTINAGHEVDFTRDR